MAPSRSRQSARSNGICSTDAPARTTPAAGQNILIDVPDVDFAAGDVFFVGMQFTYTGGTGPSVLIGLLVVGPILAVVWIMPVWFLPVVVGTMIAAAVALYYGLGHDRVIDLARRYFAMRQRRNPEKAELLRKRAARLSASLDYLARKLPERWTTGLYLPDFEPEECSHEKMTLDPWERLHNQTRTP